MILFALTQPFQHIQEQAGILIAGIFNDGLKIDNFGGFDSYLEGIGVPAGAALLCVKIHDQ